LRRVYWRLEKSSHSLDVVDDADLAEATGLRPAPNQSGERMNRFAETMPDAIWNTRLRRGHR